MGGMKRLIAAMAATAVLFGSAPAVARPAPGATAPQIDRIYLRMSRGPRALTHMVDCLINENPALARSLFDQPMGSPQYVEQSNRFFSRGPAGGCLWRTQLLKTTGLMAIGTVAQRLIEADAVSAPVRPAAGSAGQGGGTYQWTLDNLPDAMANRSLPLSYCLLERHGARVAEILAAKPVSKQERDIFNLMGGELSDCIPAGQKLTLQPHIMRAAIAIAYYTSSRQGPAGLAASE